MNRGGTVALELERIECGETSCAAFFRNLTGHFNHAITSSTGEFRFADETELHVELQRGRSVFAFVVPNAIQIWTYTRTSDDGFDAPKRFEQHRKLTNRQRWEIASKDGNVGIGRWQKNIHQHAQDLIEQQKMAAALVVLHAFFKARRLLMKLIWT